jgi:hypothetical protein
VALLVATAVFMAAVGAVDRHALLELLALAAMAAQDAYR